MTYKPFLLTIFLFAIILSCYSQQFGVTWTDNSNLKDDYKAAVQLSNGNYILLKFDRLKAFKAYEDLSPDPTLLLVNPAMAILKENKFSIGEKNDYGHRLIRYRKNVFLLFYVFEKDSQTTYVYAIKINEQAVSPGPRQLLATFDADSRYDHPEIKFSPDSSKVLVFAESSFGRKENKKLTISVLDTGLRKIWGRYAELPIDERHVSVFDEDISNEGKVFVAIKHYEKEVLPESIRNNDDKIPPYQYKMLIYTQDKIAGKEVAFDIDGRFVQGTKLAFGKNGIITIAGLYKKKPNGNIIGTFYTNFDSTISQIKNPQMVAFPSDVLTLVDKDGFGKDGGNDAGLNSGFRIKYILNRENGSLDLISEYFEFYSRAYKDQYMNSTKTDNRWIYGDVIDVNIDKSGKTIFTRVPKRQEAFDYNFAMGFYPVVYKDKLILFYNDHEDNLTRELSKEPKHFAWGRDEVFMAAIISPAGELLRTSVYSYKNEKQAAFPADMSPISPTKFLITSEKISMFGSRTRFGILEIK